MGKTFVEDERPCDSCVNVTRYGCVSWNCEYINRDEAIKAWREKHEMADRKTENSSEKPNNSTISKMEQVETMSCAECKHRPIGAEICEEPCHYEPQTDWHYDEQDATWYPYKHEDEPQQKSCATCKHAFGNWDGESNNCGRCCGADRRFYEPKDEPQTEEVCDRADGNCSECWKQLHCRAKDKQQTDCGWK